MSNISYSVAEEFTLPSRGKVYTENVNPVVKLRSMTTEHEMRRLAPSERAYKNICEIIDDCLVEDPGISAYDMCLADYQFLLHRLRAVTYGSMYPAGSTCPFCRTDNETEINLYDLEVTPFDNDDFARLSEFTLPVSNKKITIKMQTPRMVDDVTAASKERNKKSKGTSGDSAFLFTLIHMIDTVDGKRLDPIQKEDFVTNMAMMDTNYIMQHAEKLVESFGVVTEIQNTCPVCGLDYTSSFRINKEFFRPRVNI